MARSEIESVSQHVTACVCVSVPLPAIAVGSPSLKSLNGDLRTHLFKPAEIAWAADVPNWVRGQTAALRLQRLLRSLLDSKHSANLQFKARSD